MDCIVCKKPLDNVTPAGVNQPSLGLAFQSHGHYGSIVFDPMNGSYLEINVCDPCLKQAGMEGRVLIGYPKPVERGPMGVWNPKR